MSSAVPDIGSLYRLPFSKNDNPNGWLEITTHCQMGCPHCYRGCDREDRPQSHESLAAIRENIDELVRLRNCRIISISGGEPLLHPQLAEVVRYIASLGLSPWMQTNALALDQERVEALRQAGLEGIVIRVDSLQPRREGFTEEELNRVREEHARTVAAVPGVHLTFIAVVSTRNLGGMPDIVHWARTNPELVDFVGFIPLRQVQFQAQDEVDTSEWVFLEDLCRTFGERFPDLRYSSFLGSQYEAGAIKWLQSAWVVHDGQVLGYLGPKLIELFQVLHHLWTGKYAYRFGRGRSRIALATVLFLGVFVRELRPAAREVLGLVLRRPWRLLGSATVQIMAAIVPPGVHNRAEDLCDGCPDAILYEGRLVPSCGLEEVKWRQAQG